MLRAKRFHCREGRCACFEPPSFSTFPHLCVNYSSRYETGYTWRNQSTVAQNKMNQSSFQSRSETQKNLQARLQEELRHVNRTPAPSPVHLAKTDLVTVLLNTSSKWWFECSHVHSWRRIWRWVFCWRWRRSGVTHRTPVPNGWVNVPVPRSLLCRGAALCMIKTLGLEKSSYTMVD